MQKLTAILIVASFFITQVSAVLASTFGENAYGEGKYNIGVDKGSSTGNQNSGSSWIERITGRSNPEIEIHQKTSECGEQKPGSNPELYQIDRRGSSAKLYITPGGDPYNSFFISYGVGADTQQYATYFGSPSASGALSHEINGLSNGMTYSFKVQAMNGCAPSNWSNTLAVGKADGKYTKYGVTQLSIRAKSAGLVAKKMLRLPKETESIKTENQRDTTKTAAETEKKSTNNPNKSENSNERKGILDWFLSLFR